MRDGKAGLSLFFSDCHSLCFFCGSAVTLQPISQGQRHLPTYTLALKCHLTKSAQKEQEVTLVPYISTSGILGFLAPRASLAMSGTRDRQASPLGVGGFVSCVSQDHTQGLPPGLWGSSFQF